MKDMRDSSKKVTIGYLPKGYPRVSETFISNEILELENLGLDLQIFSLKNPGDTKLQPSAAKVRATAEYLPERIVLSLPLLLPVHLLLAFRRPRPYFRCLRWTLARCFKARRTSTLRRFMQAGFLVGWILRGRHIPHFHAHFCHGPATVAMFVKWLTGSTFSFTAHAKDLYLTDSAILRQKMREAEFAVTCTAFNQRYMQEVGGDACPVHLIYHGIDTERFCRSGQERIVPLHAYTEQGGLPMFLSVGRLVEKKGFDTLLRACAILKDRGHKFRCAIYGGGENRDKLQRLIETLALDECVSLPGAIMQDELVQIYRQADVFVLPCQVLANGDRDGLPNVIVEAQSMEIPVISTNVSGVPELIEDGHNGLLVGPRDPNALANAMEKLLGDADLRRQFGQAGRAKVEAEFDLKRSTRRLHALYLECLGLAIHASEESGDEEPPMRTKEGSL